MKKVQTREQLLGILRNSRQGLTDLFGVTDIAVFGSYAKDSPRRGSDIDIMVELEPSRKTFDNYMELKFFLSRITGGKIDLVLKESVREELKPVIFSEAVHV